MCVNGQIPTDLYASFHRDGNFQFNSGLLLDTHFSQSRYTFLIHPWILQCFGASILIHIIESYRAYCTFMMGTQWNAYDNAWLASPASICAIRMQRQQCAIKQRIERRGYHLISHAFAIQCNLCYYEMCGLKAQTSEWEREREKINSKHHQPDQIYVIHLAEASTQQSYTTCDWVQKMKCGENCDDKIVRDAWMAQHTTIQWIMQTFFSIIHTHTEKDTLPMSMLWNCF